MWPSYRSPCLVHLGETSTFHLYQKEGPVECTVLSEGGRSGQRGQGIAQFGLDQLKRREEGKITAQQHLAQNMDFIKQATERRLARLNERMAKE